MKAAVVFLISIFSAVGVGYPVHQLEILRKAACYTDVQALIDKWSPNARWTAHGIGEENSSVYRTPSAKSGVWLELHLQTNGKVDLYRLSPNTKTRVSWAHRECKPRLATTLGNYEDDALRGTMTDERLQSLLNKSEKGIIYAWSPHMPYSLVGLRSIRATARKLRLKLTLVLDPGTDFKFAHKEGRKAGLIPEDYRRIESVELLQRQMTMHFPSLLVYSEGKIKGPLFPGVKDEKTYESFIKDQMGHRK